MSERRMSNAQAVLLTRFAKAACPQQAFDEYTPDAWAELLGDLRYEDAEAALKAVVRRQPFVAPAEIREEVKRIRVKRLENFGPWPDPPPECAEDPKVYLQWTKDMQEQILDGTLQPGEAAEVNHEMVERVQSAVAELLPAPEKATGTQVATEKRRVRLDPRRMAEARAELAAVPIAHPDATEPSEEVS